MKVLYFLWDIILSMFSHPYERHPEYAEYMACWRQKLRAEYCSRWAMVSLFLTLSVVFIGPIDKMMGVALILLFASVLILAIATVKFEAIIYLLSEGKSTPGLFVGTLFLATVSPAVIFTLMYDSTETWLPLAIMLYTAVGVAGSSLLIAGSVGNKIFNRTWRAYLDKNPPRGYIDWDGKYKLEDPKVMHLHPVK